MSYNLLRPIHLISAQSMTSTITSSAVEIRNQDNTGIQLHWTGTPTGNFSVQVSADHFEDAQGNIVVPGHWVTVPLNPPIAAVGSPDDAYIELNQTTAAYMRVVYTASSGTGTLDAFVTAKGV